LRILLIGVDEGPWEKRKRGVIMKRLLLIAAAVLVFGLALPACGPKVVAGPAHPFAAVISGRVVYAGLGEPGVRVFVRGHGAADVTNIHGDFVIRFGTSAPAGVYRLKLELTAEKPGFYTRTVGITVRDGTTTTVRIGLKRR
jgi:hypothetical protein